MIRALSLAGFVLMVGGIVGLIATRTLLSQSVPAIGGQAAAFALMLWARRSLAGRSFHLGAEPTVGALVTAGPYRFIRHPIYTAVCLFVWASLVASPSITTFCMVALVTTGAIVRILCEERLLRQRYPEYATYATATKRMIPGIF